MKKDNQSNKLFFGYFLFKISLFKIIPNTIIIIEPTIMGFKRYSKETDPRITIIGLPPAGGWGTFKNIINATPKPTANGKVKNNGRDINTTKIIPTSEVSKWPKKIFFGCANGLSGYPYNITIVEPNDATKKIP